MSVNKHSVISLMATYHSEEEIEFLRVNKEASAFYEREDIIVMR